MTFHVRVDITNPGQFFAAVTGVWACLQSPNKTIRVEPTGERQRAGGIAAAIDPEGGRRDLDAQKRLPWSRGLLQASVATRIGSAVAPRCDSVDRGEELRLGGAHQPGVARVGGERRVRIGEEPPRMSPSQAPTIRTCTTCSTCGLAPDEHGRVAVVGLPRDVDAPSRARGHGARPAPALPPATAHQVGEIAPPWPNSPF